MRRRLPLDNPTTGIAFAIAMSVDEAETTLFENLMRLYRQLLVLMDEVDCPQQTCVFNNWLQQLTGNPSTSQSGLDVSVNAVSRVQNAVHMPINYGFRWQQNNPILAMPPCYYYQYFSFQSAFRYVALGRQQQTNVFNSLHHQRYAQLWMRVYGQVIFRPTPIRIHPVVVNVANQQTQFQHGCSYGFGHPIHATAVQPTKATCPGIAIAGQPLDFHRWCGYVDSGVPPVHATAVQPTNGTGPTNHMHTLQRPRNPAVPVEADNAADVPPELADDTETEECNSDIIARCLSIIENLKYIASWDSPD